jgi:hypothetical protein
VAPQNSSQPTAGDGQDYSIRNSITGYTIYVGGEIDLDTLPPGDSGDGLSELSMDNVTVYISHLAEYAVLGTSLEANYPNCRDAAGYIPGDQTADQLIDEGTYFCLRTSGHRYAALRLIQIGSLSWTFDIETYDPPLR